MEESKGTRRIWTVDITDVPDGWGWSVGRIHGFPVNYTASVFWPDASAEFNLGAASEWGSTPQEALDNALDKAGVTGREAADPDPNGDREGYALEDIR